MELFVHTTLLGDDDEGDFSTVVLKGNARTMFLRNDITIDQTKMLLHKK